MWCAVQQGDGGETTSYAKFSEQINWDKNKLTIDNNEQIVTENE
jgi:hypothetical protein